jgi:cytochrome c biogenesis protein
MAPPRQINEQLFSSLPFSRKLPFPEGLSDPRSWARSVLGRHYGKMVTLSPAEGKAFYLEKGRYSRFGVYLVHLSVLIIFAGALIGSFFGFKGSLELREGQDKDRIFIKGPQMNKDLGFSVKLDRFIMSFYPNGMPKEFRSDLSIWEKGQEKEKAVVRVNDPYTYKGITFYQHSWDQSPTSIKLSIKKGGQESDLSIRMDEITPIPESPYALQAVRFVSNFSGFGPALGVFLLKDRREVDQGWILASHPEFHGNRLGEFQFKVKEIKSRYLSGLQVNRDPGVWFIWIGSSLMLIGFMIAFYLSHQQVWVWVREKKTSKGGSRSEILIGGTAHKNRGAFVSRMEKHLQQVRSQKNE